MDWRKGRRGRERARQSVFYYCYFLFCQGRHTVRVLYADVDVMGSPYTVNVYDVNNVRVGRIPDGVLNKPVIFEGREFLYTSKYTSEYTANFHSNKLSCAEYRRLNRHI